MKKKKVKKLDPINKAIKELNSILDSNYFHVCTSINEKYIHNVSWKVYYKNLPTQIYFSKKNKVLLTSDKNTIGDIYKLRDKFEKEKQKEIEKNIYEYSKISYITFSTMLEIKRIYSETILDLMLLMATLNIVNIFTIKNLYFSILSLVFIILASILNYIKVKQLNRETEKGRHEIEETVIREKIRRQGTYFIKRLKEEI